MIRRFVYFYCDTYLGEIQTNYNAVNIPREAATFNISRSLEFKGRAVQRLFMNNSRNFIFAAFLLKMYPPVKDSKFALQNVWKENKAFG